MTLKNPAVPELIGQNSEQNFQFDLQQNETKRFLYYRHWSEAGRWVRARKAKSTCSVAVQLRSWSGACPLSCRSTIRWPSLLERCDRTLTAYESSSPARNDTQNHPVCQGWYKGASTSSRSYRHVGCLRTSPILALHYLATGESEISSLPSWILRLDGRARDRPEDTKIAG